MKAPSGYHSITMESTSSWAIGMDLEAVLNMIIGGIVTQTGTTVATTITKTMSRAANFSPILTGMAFFREST